jgi:hypothetical protein
MIKLTNILSEIRVNKPVLKRFDAYVGNKTVGGLEEYLVTFPDFRLHMVLEDGNMICRYTPMLFNFLNDNGIQYEEFLEENKVHIAVPVRYFNLK